MKHLTARSLVQKCLGHTHLSQKRIDEAVLVQQDRGWAMGFHPITEEPDRIIVCVRKKDWAHSLIRLSYAAACQFNNSVAYVPNAMIEGSVGLSRTDPDFGYAISRRGLALVGIDDPNVRLVGTNPSLARLINEARYDIPQRRRRSCIVIQAVLGLRDRPKVIRSQGWDKTKEAFKGYGVKIKTVSDEDKWVRLASKWTISQ